MKFFHGFVVFALVSFAVSGADVVLMRDGKSDYQIVLPDSLPTPAVAEGLAQTARLVQTAFKAAGAEVAVVAEGKRDATKPAIVLGDTAFARGHGIDAAQFKDWNYAQRVVQRDVIIAGRDHATPLRPDPKTRQSEGWDRIGTAKAAVDFLRQFMGVRFLYPEIPLRTAVLGAARVDLLASPAIEFLPLKSFSVPADLDVRKTPVLRANTAYPPSASFFDLAQNRLPRVDEPFGGHTWAQAVPPEKFGATHPEYFALINGQRWKGTDGNPQYCLSNPDVQELVYRHMARQFDEGCAGVDLGQPDGFQPCECANCTALYNTGKDWGEKIWLFDKQIVERLQKSHPGKFVTLMSYILTANPPKSFKSFPANTRVMLSGTNEEDIAPWRQCEVPGGFTGYIYNSTPNLATRYTPMRTPGYVEAQVKRLVANKIQSIYRDGNGLLFGLEGPVYYVMGRMFDDPERNSAKELLPEFCDAAFGRAALPMRSFYDQLYHAINLYSDHIGTRNDAWVYHTTDGRRRKTVTDPFQFIAFLYPPNVLAALDADLAQAEKLADSPKVKTRLALVRTEFEWIRHLSRVVHFYHAFQLQPDAPSRDRLLDAIDARNAFINSLYDTRSNAKSSANWAYVLFPLPGHNAAHLRLAHDGYQEPYANTCLNWDTRAMRAAPLPGKKRLAVARATAPVALDSPEWQRAAAHDLTVIPPLHKLPRRTTLRLLRDQTNLYIRTESELEPDAPASFPAFARDRDLRNQEALDIYIAPQPGRDLYFRFMAGANAASQWDAAAGFITDAMDPRHGRDDVAWNGVWQNQSRIDASARRWHALVTIPFKTLGIDAPAQGVVWRGNFARHHQTQPERIDRSIWSSTLGSTSIDDRAIFGEIAFE